MDVEKTIDSINVSKDLFETVINFLDIKLSNSLDEKLSHLFNNLLKSFKNLPNDNTLQKRDIEKLGLDFFTIAKISADKNKATIEEDLKDEITDISKVLEKNNRSSNELYRIENKENKAFEKEHMIDNLDEKNGLKIFNTSLKSPKFSKEQLKLALSFVKLAEISFSKKSLFKSEREQIDKPLETINMKSFKDSNQDIVKFNLKLFNDAFSKALKDHFELFQTRLIEQPPFGIVAFYVKEKDRKCSYKTSKKKRKNNSSKKQLNYKKETSEELFN